ncbi:MAG TPA: hypothetical protein VD902_11655 [Symbiobacteriaceae bacterium]|nr:hypothetical protein [Symbiobacteriaceae bacterium]
MKVRRLPNGNLLVPAATCVNGDIFWGMKEVQPGTPEYAEWSDYVKEVPQGKVFAAHASGTAVMQVTSR